MRKSVIKKILLPFLPDNIELQKHWWHRLSLTVSYLWVGFWGLFSLIFLYFFISIHAGSYIAVQKNIQLRQEIQNLLNQQDRQWDYDSAYKKDGFSYEQVLQYLTTYSKEKDSDSSFQYNYWNSQHRDWLRAWPKDNPAVEQNNDNGTQVHVDSSLFVIFLLLLAVGVFTPNLIYRILLFITTNNSWKKI